MPRSAGEAIEKGPNTQFEKSASRRTRLGVFSLDGWRMLMALDALNDEMFVVAYDELRRLARRLRRGSANLTFDPTALVHEAYIKLSRAQRFRPESPEHLKYAVVRAMKHILLDAARRQAAAIRGGGTTPLRRVSLDDPCAQSASLDPRQVLAVGFALDDLAQRSELQARVFELQFFGGFQVAEIAEMSGISEKKAQRLLRLAKASLSAALARTDGARSMNA